MSNQEDGVPCSGTDGLTEVGYREGRKKDKAPFCAGPSSEAFEKGPTEVLSFGGLVD